MRDTVTIDNERLAVLENDLGHAKDDVKDIKSDIREIKKSGKLVEIAVIKLAQIAENDQQLKPRLTKLEDKVSKNTVLLATWTGGLSALTYVLSKYGHLITP